MDYYYEKYLKYKTKYINYKNNNIIGGGKKTEKRNIKRTLNNNDVNKMDIKFSEHLSEPWFTLISLGLKTVEGRLNKGRFQEMQIGDIIEWHNEDFKERKILTKIIGKEEYKTFEEYLEKEDLNKCLPGIPTMEHGLSVYYKYFTKEKETEFGVIAIRIELI
jgi:ASC-1-like (ASCH) protein